jgi:hypothetical protein
VSTIRVDTYDGLGTAAHIDVVPTDGFAFVNVRREDDESITLTMSATELDDLAQVAATAAMKVRSGES